MRATPHRLLLASASLFLLLFRTPAAEAEVGSPKIASYQIDVILDVDAKRLFGKENLTFVNSTGSSVETLYLHLYPNAFCSDSTILMKESLFPDRIKEKEEYRGFVEVQMIKASSGLDLTERKIIDETIMRLPLECPLPPQGRIVLDIDFTVKLPRTLVRMGYSDNDFMIAQWFPKMAVLEEGGRWSANQYHFKGEFFADFGDYQVSITLPVEYTVAATGRLERERENLDSTKTLTFRAEGVHDFAWAASPDYRVARRTFDGIEIAYYHKPDHQEDAECIVDYAQFALEYYSSLFGRYPYSNFTVVDAKVGRGGGAMEYPTLITISPSRIRSQRFNLDALVVFHETAHQWWYGMVASNESEEAWLDEGFAEYSQKRALEKRFGLPGNVVNLWCIRLSDIQLTKLGYLLDPQTDPIVTRSWEFRDYLGYRSAVYFKASLVLETLRSYLGAERMDHLLKEYFRRFRFSHPKTRDFIDVVNEFADEGQASWLEPVLYSTGICDYQVSSIESVPVQKREEESKRYITQVDLRRTGEVILPVEVEMELENGKRISRSWDGKGRWHRLEIKTDSKIKSAIVDPQNRIAFELNVNNNSLTAESSDGVMMKLAGECLFWVENWMHWITCF